MALSWLRTYSTSTTTVAKWITRLENFYFDIQHIRREKNAAADALTKKTEYLELKENHDKPQMMSFAFLDQHVFDSLPDASHLDARGKVIQKTEDEHGPLMTIGTILDAAFDEPEEIEPWERDILEGEVDDWSGSEWSDVEWTGTPGEEAEGWPEQPGLGAHPPQDTETLTVNAMATGDMSIDAEHLPCWPTYAVEEDSEPIVLENNDAVKAGHRVCTVRTRKGQKDPTEQQLARDMVEFVTPQRYTFKNLRDAQHRDMNLMCIIDIVKGATNRQASVQRMSPYVRKYFFKHETKFIFKSQGVLLRNEHMPDVGPSNQDQASKQTNKRTWIVMPQMYYFNVLFEAHDRLGHPGQGKTITNIMQRFEWPGMDRDIRDYVSSCHTCQTIKQRQGVSKRFLKSIISNYPNDLVQIEHLCLPRNTSGYKAILVMIDHFSKYVEAAPCIDVTAEETANILNDRWFLRHGPPKTIQSDNGSQFTSSLMREFLKMNNVTHNLSTPYHPQTNGLVERQNRTMLALLKGFCLEKQADWPTHLQKAVFSYNSLVHATTGVTPNLLFTGSQKAIPLGNIFPDYAPEHRASTTEYIRRQQEIAQHYFAVAAKNTEANLMRQKRNHDKRVGKMENFQVGTSVMAYVKVIRRDDMRKMAKLWRGPFKITQILSSGWAYVLNNGFRVNYENLKPYMGRPHEFLCNDEEEIIIQPSTEDVDPPIEVIDLKKYPEVPAPADSEHSLMNEKIEPDEPMHMKLRDRTKIRRQFHPDFIQDYYSMISSEHEHENIMALTSEFVLDQTGASRETGDLPEGSSEMDEESASSWRQSGENEVIWQHDSINETCLATSSHANQDQAVKQASGSTGKIGQSAGSKLSHQSSYTDKSHEHFYLVNDTNVYTIETFVTEEQVNSLVFSYSDTVQIIDKINKTSNFTFPSLSPHTSPTPDSTSITSSSKRVSGNHDFPSLNISQISQRDVPPTPLTAHVDDIFATHMPIMSLISLDMQPRTMFQREIFRAMSDNQVHKIFQQQNELGDYVCVRSPRYMDTSCFVLVFARTRCMQSADKEFLMTALTKLHNAGNPRELTDMAVFMPEINLLGITMDEFYDICKRAIPFCSIHMFENYHRI